MLVAQSEELFTSGPVADSVLVSSGPHPFDRPFTREKKAERGEAAGADIVAPLHRHFEPYIATSRTFSVVPSSVPEPGSDPMPHA